MACNGFSYVRNLNDTVQVQNRTAENDFASGYFVRCKNPYSKNVVIITGTDDPTACTAIFDKMQQEFQKTCGQAKEAFRAAPTTEVVQTLGRMETQYYFTDSIWQCVKTKDGGSKASSFWRFYNPTTYCHLRSRDCLLRRDAREAIGSSLRV